MDKNNKPRQGEVLLFLANRSGKTKAEIATALEIHPGHLSKIFKSEFLTSKIKQRAALIFDVSESVFDDGDVLGVPDLVMEPHVKYEPLEPVTADAGEILKMIEKRDIRYFEERARLISMIERKDREHQAERLRLLGVIEALSKR